MQIWKYRLHIQGSHQVTIPEGAQFLTVIEQEDYPTIYFLVDPERKKTAVTFFVLGTGQPVQPEYFDGILYLGTVSCHGGKLIWHIFILLNDNAAFLHWPVRHLTHAMTRV